MPTISNVIANGDFDLGDVGWTKGGNWQIDTDFSYSGGYGAHINTDDPGVGSENSELLNENVVPVTTGQSITATARVYGVGASNNLAAVFIDWLDISFARISLSLGNSSSSSSPGSWQISNVTAVAPAGAIYARVGVYGQARENGACAVDSVSWNYVSDRAATLTSPVDAAVYTFGDAIPLSVEITGSAPAVSSVVYKDGVTTIATVTTSPYSTNITTLAVGTHVITAEVTLTNGVVITTAAATIEVSATPPTPTLREFKASNSYSYLVASNFSGLSKAMPSVARVTGVELLLDYTLRVEVRSKDLEVEDPEGSNPNVVFDITDGGIVEAILLSETDGVYTTEGSSITAPITIERTDFDVTETGTSEEKLWTMLDLTTPASVTVGNDTALFGLPSIAATDFIGRSVGIRFYPTLLAKPDYADSGDAIIRFLINKLRLRVYFDAGSAEYYFASPDKTQVIKGELVASSVTDGDFETGDAEGELQLQPDLVLMDDDDITTTQTWIGDDWTIHAAYPPTDANQIGTVAARAAADGIGMSYNGLPATQDVVDNRSRYVFITANFFAVSSLDSIYGVHGLPRAFAYNGDFFYKINTQPDPEKDKPRHVAYHHGHLALGFDDGRVDISVIGQPYNYDGALGASEWSIGDKVTGLLPLTGTILGIFGSKSIWGLNGTTVDNFSTQVIAPNVGALEYTITDMGFPVYANAYGVYTLAQTQQYGDYLGSPMSQDISPWLRPRLVRKYSSDKEVVVAWPVRSKNQYRLAFADGYVMSMTLNAGQQSAPTFSFQQYTLYNTDPIEILVPAAVSSQLDVTGEERIHVAQSVLGSSLDRPTLTDTNLPPEASFIFS